MRSLFICYLEVIKFSIFRSLRNMSVSEWMQLSYNSKYTHTCTELFSFFFLSTSISLCVIGATYWQGAMSIFTLKLISCESCFRKLICGLPEISSFRVNLGKTCHIWKPFVIQDKSITVIVQKETFWQF